MTYTRRSFLRDTGMVSLAGAMGTTSLITGCFGTTSFESGVRIFFAGSWIFCGIHNDSQNMMAVAIDPCNTQPCSSDTDVVHIFPYGIWYEGAGRCGEGWNLGQYNQGWDLPLSTKDEPHSVTVSNQTSNWTAPPGGVNRLFEDANKSSRFVCMQGKSQRKIPDAHWKNSVLRVIQLPIPTRIIPAAFLEHATVCDPKATMQACTHHRDKGVATSHIFEYLDAGSIQFALSKYVSSSSPAPKGSGPQPVSAPAGTNFKSDLHFHTVPVSPVVPVDHPRSMFHHMVKFLDEDACLNVGLEGCMMDTMRRGDLVPSSVSLAELQISNPSRGIAGPHCDFKVNLASCDSGGLGISCPPEGC